MATCEYGRHGVVGGGEVKFVVTMKTPLLCGCVAEPRLFCEGCLTRRLFEMKSAVCTCGARSESWANIAKVEEVA